MNYTVENSTVILELSSHAAEMHSLKRKDSDYEYLWNGDKAYWTGRNPILFPQISSTAEKINVIHGKEYPMGNHGFARSSEFVMADKKEDEITFVLKENEETLKQYPYAFTLKANYRLKENGVKISYTITNENREDMPFGFGMHPAFMCAPGFKDTKVVFDDTETVEISNALFKEHPTYYLIPCDYQKAVLYTNGHSVTLDISQFKNCAIWSPFAPFVCVEPWVSAPVDGRKVFEEREDNVVLKPGEKFEISYTFDLA